MRGWSNTRANWELWPLCVLQSILVAGLLAAGVAVPLFAVGLSLWSEDLPTAERLQEALGRLTEAPAQLLLPAIACLALWTLAFLVYSYFQAGLYGVLHGGERQAAPGAVRDRRFFRTFGGRDFSGWSGRFVWRFFWFFNLAGFLFTGALVLAIVWLGLIFLAGTSWGAPAAWGIGCGGALPVLFTLFVLILWLNLAQAELVRDGAGVFGATRAGFDVLARRPGAAALLIVVFFVAGLAVSLVFVPLKLGAGVLFAGRPLAAFAASLSLSVLQMIPSALLNVALAGAAVALVSAERSARRTPERVAA
jgi:hypothetical protein